MKKSKPTERDTKADNEPVTLAGDLLPRQDSSGSAEERVRRTTRYSRVSAVRVEATTIEEEVWTGIEIRDV